MREVLGLPSDDPIPKLARSGHPANGSTKRNTADGDVEMSAPDKDAASSEPTAPPPAADQAFIHAQAAASYISFLTAEDLLPPKMPTRQEMETVLLGLRKRALVEEYFGADDALT